MPSKQSNGKRQKLKANKMSSSDTCAGNDSDFQNSSDLSYNSRNISGNNSSLTMSDGSYLSNGGSNSGSENNSDSSNCDATASSVSHSSNYESIDEQDGAEGSSDDEYNSDSDNYGSQSENDSNGNSSGSEYESNDSAHNGETQSDDYFSEEYTLSSSSGSSSNSQITTMPQAVRKAGKSLDMNNNNNKPTAAKQQTRDKKQPVKQEQKAKADGKSANKAPSCPLPRRPIQTMIQSCPLPSKAAPAKPIPSTSRLSSRESLTKTKAKSCRLSSAPALKMANKMAAAEKKSRKSSNETQLQTGMEKPRGPVHQMNSIEEGKRMLHWLINPMTSDCFFEQYWERNACQVKRKQPNYFEQLISFKMIDEMLINHHLEFTTNIDVTSYKKGVRQTLNPDGRAMPPTVWGFYGEGCSIRILNPSSYLCKLRQLCSMMQEFFHCLVGANVYLTPPNSQGFAPHYDDIEAFVLQVEGRKRWRLYAPPQSTDVLARTSSGNYKQEELGQPLFDAVLEPGDILYFPRGTVHQAVTEQKQHSLHITLSVYQQQAYANLLEVLMPSVMERAIKHHLTLRRGLPLHIWQHLGLANGGQQSELRNQLLENTKRLVQQYLVPSDAQIDSAVDQLAKRFQHEALPPCLKPEEHVRTVFGSRSETDASGQCLCDYELTERTSVRLLRANILRLVADGSSLRVYYYVDNALEYCKYEANFMEIQPSEAPAVEALMTSYPAYMKVAKLPLRSADRRIEVATALWERGLLMTEKPFK